MFKNVVEIFLALVFIGLNLVVGLESSDATVLCDIELLGSATVVTMQCRQKRYDVFIHLLSLFTITLVFHALVNICSVCWGIPYTGLRQITGIMTELQEAIKSSRAYKKSVKSGKRKDMSHDAEMGLRLSLAADRFVLILCLHSGLAHSAQENILLEQIFCSSSTSSRALVARRQPSEF